MIEGLWAVIFGFGVIANGIIYMKEVDNFFATLTFGLAGYFLLMHGFETLH